MRMRSSLFSIGFLLLSLVFPWFVMGPAGNFLTNISLRLGLFALLALGGSWLLHRAWQGRRYFSALLLTALVYGTANKLASYLPDLSTYPFSLGWSEVSRYYYASLFFADKIYGSPLPLSVLHPTRYLMQSLPYLIPAAPLWLHRAWQVILWISMTGLTAWLVWRRIKGQRMTEDRGQEAGHRGQEKESRGVGVAIVLFSFLFLLQGPVYYHLLVMVVLLLWAYDSQHPWRTLGVVLAASLWAGVSRINWLPMPGMIAAALYFLEIPCASLKNKEEKSDPTSRLAEYLRYLGPPAAWLILGTGAGYLMQEIYKPLSGNPAAVFGSSFTSDLLWYRLLPNPTFQLGILPSAVLVSLPLLLLAGLRVWKNWQQYHPVRILGLAGMLFVLFTGGVVVSVKIGGGSNLHNLDGYLVLLLLTASLIFFDKFTPERPDQARKMNIASSLGVQRGLMLLAVAIPCYFSLSSNGLLPERDFTSAQTVLQEIRQYAESAASQDRDVLFISQRHLLTFGMLGEVDMPLVADYEQVFLMEMAMGGNRDYLQAFQADLQAQRFALIVSDPLTTTLQGKAHSFGEENDAWVRKVTKPILCYYEPVLKYKEPAVMLLVPRQNPCK